MGNYLVFPLVSAVSVFFFWLVELWLPYPWLVEEVFKFVLVVQIRQKVAARERLAAVLLSGLALGVSEAFFYLLNYVQAGSLVMFVWRLALTVPLHLVTFLILFWGSGGGRYRQAAALVVAGLIHFGFNRLSANIFG